MVNASKIKRHILMNKHTDDFTSLSLGGDNELLEIKECPMIRTLKPTLNDNTTSKELFLSN